MIRSFMSNAGAVLGGLALSCFTREFFEGEGGGGSGGGAGGGEGGGKGGDDKVTLSKAELKKQQDDAVAAAVDQERKQQAEKDKKAKEEADRKAAEDQGKHKDLYEKEKADRAKDKADADLKLARKDADIALRDYLSEKHPAYAGVAKYIMPLVEITPDMKEADIKKAITTAADQYVKDNPRGTAAGAPRNKKTLNAGEEVPAGEAKKPRISAPLRRAF